MNGCSLQDFVGLLGTSKVACLNKLKECGVAKLPERQKFANGLSKVIRAGFTSEELDAAAAKTAELDVRAKAAAAAARYAPRTEPPKKLVFKTYNDRITATALIESLAEQTKEQQKSIDALGSSTKPLPATTTGFIIGAGMSGIHVAAELVTTGGVQTQELCIAEKTAMAGGVWRHQANSYSRVNSSEPAYRTYRKPHAHKDTYTNHTPTYLMSQG